jgi:outer membrane biosynthesis protein TonB
MAESEIIDARKKIINYLRIKGPSLPIHISKEINSNTLFTSAYLSELAKEKQLKISNLKVGGSPVYYLQGQEKSLESFSSYLPGKEKEAFQLLKEKSLLKDSQQEPAIRVALRNLKDFAKPFRYNEQIYWAYHLLSKEQIQEILEPKKQTKQEIPEQRAEKKQEKNKEIPAQKIPEKAKEKPKQEKPLLNLKESKQKNKEKSEFVLKIIEFLKLKDFELTEEIEEKKREFTGKIKISSDIGKIAFLLVSKEKKTITENDLTIAREKAQNRKMALIFLSTGNLNKKAEKYLNTWKNLIIFKRIQ